jgi:NAD(P)-dependent dehydrogenase (short-subunit alcohol dehydrogenase family)
MSKLASKVAVITGGNSGIGLASAKRFKAEGATVIINARNEKRLAETLAENGDIFDDVFVADVSNVSDLARFFAQIGEKYGKIDVLFLNAGVAYFAPIELLDEATYDKQFDINVKGVLFGVQKALPYLNEGASILLTTSVVNQQGMANSNAYAATKAAVRSLARSLSAELVGRGIRVNAISPGPIETPIFSKMGLPNEQVGQMAEGIKAGVPLGRFGTPDEVASAALYLASAESSFIVGEELVIAGGMGTL